MQDTLAQPLGPAWRDFAACMTVGPEPFFPEKGDWAMSRQAKAICATCPVTSDCLTYAFRIGADFGIFGGLTAEERRVMLRRERRVVA